MTDIRTGGERIQLILVGALALAVVFVTIALVLNSAIFAENIATRANQQEAADVVSLEREATQGTGVAIHHLHHDAAAHGSYSDLEDRLDAAIDEWSRMIVRESAREGEYVDLRYASSTRGTRLAQDDGTAFEPQDTSVLSQDDTLSGITYWTVAPDVGKMRDFTIEAERSSLGSITESEAEDYLRNLGTGSYSLDTPPFAVVYDVNDDGDVDHAFTIYQDGEGSDSDDVKLSYYDGSIDEVSTCEVTDADATFTVDVSGATVEDGRGSCGEVLAFTSGITDPYQLFYVSGSKIDGDWEFVIDEDISSLRADFQDFFDLLGLTADFSDYYEPHTDGHGSTYGPSSPYVEPAIYSATVSLDYRSKTASYESTVTVAPNEP